MWRWSYDGSVCSGDFLSKADKQAQRDAGGDTIYLIAEGNFLEGVIIAIYSMIGLLLIAVLMLALFCSQ
jgi:hypothetical protein